MADEAYYRWVAAGKPYVRSLPAEQTKLAIRGHGYTVYDYPNTSHQLADPAEDHTAYSEVGWPIASKEWVGHAIDIMPPDPAAVIAGVVASLPMLARQIIKDKDAGVPGTRWIKYMNWTDEAGICHQERWMPDHTTRPSTDQGHIHISARSDVDTSDEVAVSGWDPVERVMNMTDSPTTYYTGSYVEQGVIKLTDPIVIKSSTATDPDSTGAVVVNELSRVLKRIDSQAAQNGSSLSKIDAKLTALGAELNGKLDKIQQTLDSLPAGQLTLTTVDHLAIVRDVKTALQEGTGSL